MMATAACVAPSSGVYAAPGNISPAIPSAQDAPIALLIDLSSGQTLFARDIDRRFMPASMTKVMTVFTAFEWMHEGKLFPQQVITVTPDIFDKWHGVGSTMFLPENARVTVDQLLHGITTVSANDGAATLAHGAAGSVAKWVAAMNSEARSIGMTNSHYGTPNGWMDQGGTFVTARDLAILAKAMIERYPDYYHRYFGARTLTYNGITQRNHDPITGVVPGADGIKTGFTNQAGYGFLGSAERNGRRLVMVVATSPTGKQRNKAARELMEWGFDAFDSRVLFGANTKIAKARVQNGGLSRVKLISPQPIRVDVPSGTHPKISLNIRYFGPLRAPIAKGEHVADLLISIDGREVSTRPLVSDRAVSTATIMQRIFNGFARWLP
ncbi:MAG: D-alanyl-D-alanine carboxypeptidase family protein [Sphingomonadaceae bacterium]